MLSVQHQRCSLRRTACATLVAWLLALTTGIVNACLLQGPVAGVASAAIGPATVAARDTEVALHGEHVDHDAGATHANCQKFCADESTSLAKNGGKSFDFLQLAVVEFALQPRLADIAAARVARRFTEPPSRPGPSLVIRLLRLTT